MKNISVVIPCYRSENTISKVIDELRLVFAKRSECEYEIVLVNDGSPDGVWKVIEECAKKDDHVIGVNLSQNYGQHCALMAGYKISQGKYVVSMDDDGQTPADALFSLVDKCEEGYDVVYASYPEYHQNLVRRIGSDLSAAVTNLVFGFKGKRPKGSSYYVMRRFVVDEIVRYSNPYPYISGLILRVTRNVTVVPVEHRERIAGKSNYDIRKLFSLWVNSFTAFTVKPLELGAYVGFFFAVCGFLFALITIIRKLLNPSIQAGWSSIMAALMVIGGIIMMMLGIIGEYIGRIYICINNSPQYVIKEIVRKDE